MIYIYIHIIYLHTHILLNPWVDASLVVIFCSISQVERGWRNAIPSLVNIHEILFLLVRVVATQIFVVIFTPKNGGKKMVPFGWFNHQLLLKLLLLKITIVVGLGLCPCGDFLKSKARVPLRSSIVDIKMDVLGIPILSELGSLDNLY